MCGVADRRRGFYLKFIIISNFIFLLYFTCERFFEIASTRFVDYLTGFSVLFSLVLYLFFMFRKSVFVFYLGSFFLLLNFFYFLSDAWLYPLGGVLYSLIASFFYSFLFVFPVFNMYGECKKPLLFKGGT